MKRVFSTLATAGLSLAVLAACGGTTDSTAGGEAPAGGTENVTLSVWAPQEDQAEGASWLGDMEAAFADAHPEYNITWTNNVVSEGDAAKQVQTDPAAAADVYLFANDQLGTLVDLGAIGQLGENELAQVKEQNDQTMIDSVTAADGNVYGVPFTGNTWFMYYNASKFSAEDAKSLDTMLEKGKVSFPLDNGWYFQAFYTDGAGLDFFGEASNDASKGITFSKGAEAATAVTSALVDITSNPNFVNDKDGAGLAGLKDGSVDVLFSGTWDAQNVKDALGDNYGATVPPMFMVNGEQAQMQAFAGSKAVAYNPNAKNTKAAAQFAAFLGSTDAQKAHYEMRGIVPTDKALASEIKADDLAAKAQVDTIAMASVVQPTIAAMGGWWDPAAAMGAGLLNKEITADNAGDQTAAWADQLAAMKG